MRGLGKSSILRVAAAFVLLALRPSMIVLGVALLNDFSDAHASIQYLGDDLEAHQLHPSRQLWSGAMAAKAHFHAPAFLSPSRYFSAPGRAATIPARPARNSPSARHLATGSRSPPL